MAAVALIALLGACKGSSPETDDSTSSDSSQRDRENDDPAATSPGDDGQSPPAVGVPDRPAIVDGVANSLILVHDTSGEATSLASFRADGTIVASYMTDRGVAIWQPIWSPDGRRVAWTRSSDGSTWELVTAAVDGGDRTAHPLPGRPDYITFDPTAARVLALTPSPGGFGLVIVELDVDAGDQPDEAATAIDIGQPYFSDFSPQGDRVIAHVGSEMRLVDVTGERLALDFESIGHQTPAWHPSDEVVFFAADDETGNRLVLHDLTSEGTSALATFAAFILFDVDPTGERVAVSAFGLDGLDGDDAVIALRSPSSRAQPATVGSGLWLVDVADGTTLRLAADPTVAPMWDPTGTHVLVRITLGGIGRWIAYGLDGSETGTDNYDVGGTLLPAYLPFWDQYARSQTLWSPDGGHFVHVGRSEAGASGVWIHDVSTSGRSSFLAAGDMAFWSPT